MRLKCPKCVSNAEKIGPLAFKVTPISEGKFNFDLTEEKFDKGINTASYPWLFRRPDGAAQCKNAATYPQ